MLAQFESENVHGGVLITIDGHTKFIPKKTAEFFAHGEHMYAQGVDLYDCFPGLTEDELHFLKVSRWEERRCRA